MISRIEMPAFIDHSALVKRTNHIFSLFDSLYCETNIQTDDRQTSRQNFFKKWEKTIAKAQKHFYKNTYKLKVCVKNLLTNIPVKQPRGWVSSNKIKLYFCTIILRLWCIIDLKIPYWCLSGSTASMSYVNFSYIYHVVHLHSLWLKSVRTSQKNT